MSPKKRKNRFQDRPSVWGRVFFFLRFLLFYILDLSRRGRRAPRGSESSKPRQHRHAQLEEALQHRFYSCCSGTGAAQTGHVASLIPRLPTHRSSHSKAHERWNSWPQPSRKEGLSAQKRSRQVGQVSSSSSLSSSSVEGGSFEFLASLRLGLLEERRWGAGIALVVAAVVEVPAAAAATAAAELSAFESSGVPSSDDDEELLFRRCCL